MARQRVPYRQAGDDPGADAGGGEAGMLQGDPGLLGEEPALLRKVRDDAERGADGQVLSRSVTSMDVGMMKNSEVF